MRIVTMLAAAALALPLAACESGEPEADDANIQVAEGDDAQEIATMAEGARNATFLRAIRDAGRDCQSVDSSAAAGEVGGAPAWTATCDNGVPWTIIIGANGTATVTPAGSPVAAGGQPQGG